MINYQLLAIGYSYWLWGIKPFNYWLIVIHVLILLSIDLATMNSQIVHLLFLTSQILSRIS
jgi:hypothetical protein